MDKKLESYCVGCGLCEAIGKAQCKEDKKGFRYPVSGDESWLNQVCPAGGSQQSRMDFGKIWGRSEAAWYCWSNDEKIRHSASSGGILTETASWLLNKHYVDAVIHVAADPDDPTRTVCCLSHNREELLSHCGSRYAISHPLEILADLDFSERYAFIGKPCDVVALKNYMKVNEEIKKSIPYTLSFFCAGLPSVDAQNSLVDFLGVPKDKLQSLRYRGEGWPGYTIAKDIDGETYQTDYNTSWGKILGRDIMRACRFCLDGIGEAADISCGDAWYLTKDKKPDFTEAEGRNIIFARTKRGKELLGEMIQGNAITVSEAPLDELKFIQRYQMERRATMVDKIFALKLFRKPAPDYKLRNLHKYAGEVSLKKHLSVMKGTAARIIKGKI